MLSVVEIPQAVEEDRKLPDWARTLGPPDATCPRCGAEAWTEEVRVVTQRCKDLTPGRGVLRKQVRCITWRRRHYAAGLTPSLGCAPTVVEEVPLCCYCLEQPAKPDTWGRLYPSRTCSEECRRAWRKQYGRVHRAMRVGTWKLKHETRICAAEDCDRTFTPKAKNHIYCSRKCQVRIGARRRNPGRKARLTTQHKLRKKVLRMLRAGIWVAEIVRETGLHRTTIYYMAKRHRIPLPPPPLRECCVCGRRFRPYPSHAKRAEKVRCRHCIEDGKKPKEWW